MKPRFLVLLMPLLVMPLTAWSQSRKAEIALGSVVLRLGMPKDEVIAALASVYRLEPRGHDDWWGVVAKGLPYEPLAHLGFDSGKLVYVSKRHFKAHETEKKASALARAFHVLVTAFVLEQGNSCTIQSMRHETTTFEQKRVTMQCGQKVLVLEIDRDDTLGDHVTIEEVMGALPRQSQPKAK